MLLTKPDEGERGRGRDMQEECPGYETLPGVLIRQISQLSLSCSCSFFLSQNEMYFIGMNAETISPKHLTNITKQLQIVAIA